MVWLLSIDSELYGVCLVVALVGWLGVVLVVWGVLVGGCVGVVALFVAVFVVNSVVICDSFLVVWLGWFISSLVLL